MKIGQRRPDSDGKSSSAWLFVLVCIFGLGLYLGNRGILSQAWNLLSTPTRLFRPSSPAQALPTLMVEMRFQNYNGLLQRREQAIQSGVYIPANRDLMTATIQLDNSLIPVSMRLYPGTAEHLAGPEGWSFDVRTRQSQQLLDMQRFSLHSSAGDDELYQWAFRRALEREGILATRYHLVNLVFNGDDWGTYALQEGFGDELMTSNGRTAGVILEFDADLLWKSIAHFGDSQAANSDPVANLLASDFRYFEIDTFRDATIARDELRLAQQDAGTSRLRALQAGQATAAEIFDVEKYGRFLALVDLWGVNSAVTLVNLRYYFNPDTDLLEPIGSVSSLTGAKPLESTERLPLAAAYNDPILQAAYAHEAQRLSQPAYLTELQAELESELLASRRGELSELWAALAERQEQVRRSLNPVQPVFAYLGPLSMNMSGTIQIDIANVINLPVEILGFDIQGLTFLDVDPAWLQSETAADLLTVGGDQVILNTASSHIIRYVRFQLPITEIIRRDQEIDFAQAVEIRVATRILGLDTHQLTLAREEASEQVIQP